jgi:hypothetical protein
MQGGGQSAAEGPGTAKTNKIKWYHNTESSLCACTAALAGLTKAWTAIQHGDRRFAGGLPDLLDHRARYRGGALRNKAMAAAKDTKPKGFPT